MSPLVINRPYNVQAPALLGVVYQDTFGGLSLAYLNTDDTTWTGITAVMAAGGASPWSSVGINTTITGANTGQASDLTYCSTTDELYWSGTGAASVERVTRTTGASAGSITPPASGNCHSIAYDKINDEFHVSMFVPPGGAGGKISSFITRVNLDAGTWPISGTTVYFENFGGGMNGQEQWALAWDELGTGVLNGPHAGTLYALSGFFGLDFVTNWSGDGSTNGTGSGGGGIKSLAINNLHGSDTVYSLRSTGATVTAQRWTINTAPSAPTGGGSATMTTTQLPNYNNSGFAWLFEYA